MVGALIGNTRGAVAGCAAGALVGWGTVKMTQYNASQSRSGNADEDRYSRSDPDFYALNRPVSDSTIKIRGVTASPDQAKAGTTIIAVTDYSLITPKNSSTIDVEESWILKKDGKQLVELNPQAQTRSTTNGTTNRQMGSDTIFVLSFLWKTAPGSPSKGTLCRFT